nr:unnamed protein product [Callosobruchus chinensis]
MPVDLENGLSKGVSVSGQETKVEDHGFESQRSRATSVISLPPVKKKISTDKPHRSATSSRCSSPTHLDEEQDRSWWFTFCMRCRSDENAEKPSWHPPWWPKLCPQPYFPTYRQFSRIISLVFIGLFSWCVLYAIIGETAGPSGMLFQLIILSICAHIGGWLMSLTTLPGLVGMLFTGIILQNVGVVDLDESFTEISECFSDVALVIILIRAGLELDPRALPRLKFTVLKLAILPWIAEAAVVTVTSAYLLDLPWKFAVLLGCIIAAVAPAVVVPCLFRLRSKGYGVSKGIPTLIIAVASIDDAASVAMFGVLKSIVFSDSSLVNVILQGPLSIAGGLGFGAAWGYLCSLAPERNDPFAAPLRVLLLLAGGMGAVFGGSLVGYGGAGPLGCVAAGFVAISMWSKIGWDVEDNPATTAFEIFWMIFQPILFGITGARVKINELKPELLGLCLGVLLTGIVIRMAITTFFSIGCKLNNKEKVFVSVAWMCKAIVQKTPTIKKIRLKAKEKRKFFEYSQSAIKNALYEIRENHLSIRKASEQFGVPRSTLQDIIKGKTLEDARKRTGPPPILTWEGEEKIAKWVVEIAKCGFPIKKSDFLSTVRKIAQDLGKSALFKNKTPGQKWYLGFLKRHPEISLREAEAINKARAVVTEESIRKWFSELQLFLMSNNLMEVMEDPTRIFNGDESGFSLCPKSGKVLAPKGFKNLYKITTGKEKENITVFMMFSADGAVCPPFVVFPYVRPPKALVKSMPPRWVLGRSEKGWMTTEAFYEYLYVK